MPLPSRTHHAAASGVDGNIRIGNYDLPAATWEVHMFGNELPLPNVASGRFVDVISGGHRRATLIATGTWRSDFNPFRGAFIYLGALLDVTLTVDSTGADGTQATFPKALILHWRIFDDANGAPRFELGCCSTYTFTDFGGLNA